MIDLEAPQPGGRDPAPGALALVQAFLNTHYDMTAEGGGELLIDSSVLARWLRERRLLADDMRLTAIERERALSVREGLRALAFANNGRPPDAPAMGRLHHASAGAHTEVRLDVNGPSFRAPTPSTLDGALGVLLAISAGAMLDGSWPRLKACPGRDCAWVFYDRTRNQSARWCAMKVCGDREKARAYYERKKQEHAQRRPRSHS